MHAVTDYWVAGALRVAHNIALMKVMSLLMNRHACMQMTLPCMNTPRHSLQEALIHAAISPTCPQAPPALLMLVAFAFGALQHSVFSWADKGRPLANAEKRLPPYIGSYASNSRSHLQSRATMVLFPNLAPSGSA